MIAIASDDSDEFILLNSVPAAAGEFARTKSYTSLVLQSARSRAFEYRVRVRG